MSVTGSFKLSKLGWNLKHDSHATSLLQYGDTVRVRRMHSPLSGKTGRIVEIAEGDMYGPYLVQFDNGLRFRYQRNELIALTYSSDSAMEHR
jgi:hypothetical protein